MGVNEVELQRTIYVVFRSFRVGRIVIFFRQMDDLRKIYLEKRKMIASIYGVTCIIFVIHVLGLGWIYTLCQPGWFLISTA